MWTWDCMICASVPKRGFGCHVGVARRTALDGCARRRTSTVRAGHCLFHVRPERTDMVLQMVRRRVCLRQGVCTQGRNTPLRGRGKGLSAVQNRSHVACHRPQPRPRWFARPRSHRRGAPGQWPALLHARQSITGLLRKPKSGKNAQRQRLTSEVKNELHHQDRSGRGGDPQGGEGRKATPGGRVPQDRGAEPPGTCSDKLRLTNLNVQTLRSVVHQ